MNMSSVATLLGRSTGPRLTAADLADQLAKAEAEREALRAKEQELSNSRLELLLTGEDAEIDALEAELANVHRALDRHDVRIPEMRRRHGELVRAERRAADERDFEAAASAHVATAKKIDEAFKAIGKLFDAFDQSGQELRRLQSYHGANRVGDGSIGLGEPDHDNLKMAILYHAPHLARALRITEFAHFKMGPFGEREAEFWSRVRAMLKARSTSPGTTSASS